MTPAVYNLSDLKHRFTNKKFRFFIGKFLSTKIVNGFVRNNGGQPFVYERKLFRKVYLKSFWSRLASKWIYIVTALTILALVFKSPKAKVAGFFFVAQYIFRYIMQIGAYYTSTVADINSQNIN